jgi:CarD family transcriptional regulator
MKASSERTARPKAAPVVSVAPARVAGKARPAVPPPTPRRAETRAEKKTPAIRKPTPPKASAAPAPKSTPETRTKVTKAKTAVAEVAPKKQQVAKPAVVAGPEPVAKATKAQTAMPKGAPQKPAAAKAEAPKPAAPPPAKPEAKAAAKPAVAKAGVAEPRPEPRKEARIEAKADPKAPARPAGLAEPQAAVAPPPPAPRPASAHPAAPNGRPAAPSRASSKDEIFAEGDHVVYPTHGVGKVEKIAVEDIAGHRLELIHITFEENRMTLRVPVAKARSAGLRKLATRKLFDDALAVLKGRARIKRTMWSRRAQEYEAKINSGDPMAIAEVVRDLHRNAGQPDQSFSERQIYEAAMDRLAAELAALDKTDKPTAAGKLADFLKTI